MQIYTNFESNSQPKKRFLAFQTSCFRCKFTQILKAIHNALNLTQNTYLVVSDANLHKF